LIDCGAVYKVTWDGVAERLDGLEHIDDISGDRMWVRSGSAFFELATGRTLTLDTDLDVLPSRTGFIAGPDSQSWVFNVVFAETATLETRDQMPAGTVPLPALSSQSPPLGIDAEGRLSPLSDSVRRRLGDLPEVHLSRDDVVASGNGLVLMREGRLSIVRGYGREGAQRVETNWWTLDTRPVSVDPQGNLALFSLTTDDGTESLYAAMHLRYEELYGVFTVDGQILPPVLGGHR